MEASNIVKQTRIGLPSCLVMLEHNLEWTLVVNHVSNDIPQQSILSVSMEILKRNQQGNQSLVMCRFQISKAVDTTCG
jgi:hypothetical protein